MLALNNRHYEPAINRVGWGGGSRWGNLGWWWGGGGGMRQQILGSHTPPCHRRMVITTLFNLLLAALQRRPVLYHTRWLLTVHGLWPSGH